MEELKKKLIELTLKYTELESYDNKEAREIKHEIDVITNSMYWFKWCDNEKSKTVNKE